MACVDVCGVQQQFKSPGDLEAHSWCCFAPLNYNALKQEKQTETKIIEEQTTIVLS